MAEQREYVKLWLSYKNYFESYSNEEIGRLVLAMIDYRESGALPDFSGSEKFIWPAIRRDIDESVKAQEKQSEANRGNGKKGGRPPKSEESEQNRKNPFGFEESEKRHGQGQGQGQGNNITPKSPKGDDAFDVFWKAYPKKVGKGAARKAFSKVKVPVESLVSAIERQKCSLQWSRDNGQYIPNPSTWLNQGRWDDEMPGSAMNAPLERPKPVRYRLDENGDLCVVED